MYSSSACFARASLHLGGGRTARAPRLVKAGIGKLAVTLADSCLFWGASFPPRRGPRRDRPSPRGPPGKVLRPLSRNNSNTNSKNNKTKNNSNTNTNNCNRNNSNDSLISGANFGQCEWGLEGLRHRERHPDRPVRLSRPMALIPGDPHDSICVLIIRTCFYYTLVLCQIMFICNLSVPARLRN